MKKIAILTLTSLSIFFFIFSLKASAQTCFWSNLPDCTQNTVISDTCNESTLFYGIVGHDYCCCHGLPNHPSDNIQESQDIRSQVSLEEYNELTKREDLNPLGELNVRIPGIEAIMGEYTVQCSMENGVEVCKVPWIAIYIKAIYEYSLSVVGILAAIMLIMAGVLWMTAGGRSETVSQAKNWIAGSISGLALLLVSYALLNIVNPQLTNLSFIKLNTIPDLGGDVATASDNGAGGPFSGQDNSDVLSKASIYCPKSGGSESIAQIANSFGDKVVYRLGSKNGKGDEINLDNIQDTYGLSCPNQDPWNENIVCYDCSGFVRQVLWCAGLTSDPGMGTSVIFPGTEEIESCKDNLINDQEVKAGDLIGWYPVGDGSNSGHVFIYIGNNTLADAHGARSYPPASAYKTGNLCSEISKYEGRIKPRKLHIKRINF